MKLVSLIEIDLNEHCSMFCISRHLSLVFLIQNGLKLGEALSPLLFKFALECPIWEVHEGLELSGTYQCLACADCLNVLVNT